MPELPAANQPRRWCPRSMPIAACGLGAEFLFDPEISGGKGLSSTLGVAAFPTGIVYRVGDPAPAAYIARLAISQTIGLGGGRVTNEAGANELADIRDRDVFAITVGRFSVDRRLRRKPLRARCHGALLQLGAVCVRRLGPTPQTRSGYTWGSDGRPCCRLGGRRAGIALEPKFANEATMDWRVGKSHGLMAEYEARYAISRSARRAQHSALLDTSARMRQLRASAQRIRLATTTRSRKHAPRRTFSSTAWRCPWSSSFAMEPACSCD